MLERENAFYTAHQAEYREKYLNKWLIIANESLFGVYNTPSAAVTAAQEHFKNNEFLLHRPMDDDMTLEIGPMGVIRLRRPHAPKRPKPNFTVIAAGGKPVYIPYAGL